MNTTQSEFKESLRIIWTIAAKDMVDALKNKTTITIIAGVALLMLQSQALPLIVKLQDIPTAVVYDVGESQLVKDMGNSDELLLYEVPSQQELETTLGESNGAVLGLVIPANFDQAIAASEQVELDGCFAHSANRSDAAETRASFEQALTELAGKPVRIHIEGNTVYPRPDAGGRPFMVSMYVVIVIILISVIVVPHSMIEEKVTHTLDALLVSPASIRQVVAGKALAGMVYGLSAGGVVLAFNRAMVVHWEIAILAAICGTLFSVAVGLLMGSLFDNPQNLSLGMGAILLVLMMPMFLVNFMGTNWPAIVRAILPWIPSVALEHVIRISFSGSTPLAPILSNLGIVLGGSILVLAVVVWRVRQLDR